MDGFPDHPSHWCTPPHSEACEGSCISRCRYVDAWQTAATGWGDKTAHFFLGTSDSAASSAESCSTGPDWNWITQQHQEGVGTRLSEQSLKTTGSGLRFQAQGGSVEYDCVYVECIPVWARNTLVLTKWQWNVLRCKHYATNIVQTPNT